MKTGRGRATAICFMVAALLVLIGFGVTFLRKREEAGPLRPRPAPLAGPPRVTLGMLVQELGDGSLQVTSLKAGGPAEKGSLRKGDVLKGFAGFSVKTLEDMSRALGAMEPGVKVPVVVIRDGVEIVLSVTPATRP